MSMRPPSRNVKEATGYMSLKVAEARNGERDMGDFGTQLTF